MIQTRVLFFQPQRKVRRFTEHFRPSVGFKNHISKARISRVRPTNCKTFILVGIVIHIEFDIFFRDFRFRGAIPEFTFFLWDSVRKNELVNILPYAPACDITFNTVIDYEIGMLKPHLLPLLSAIPESNSHFHAARQMLLSLDGIDAIDEKYLPTHAMYHEFLG